MLVDFMRTAISFVTAAALIAFPIIVILALVGRVRHRGLRGLPSLAGLALGLVLGYGLLVSEAAPPVRTATILLTFALVIGTSLTGRMIAAGLLLAAASASWALYFGAAILDQVRAEGRTDPGFFLPPFLVGAIGVAVGIAFVKFQIDYEARHPRPSATVPEATRSWDAASRAAIGPTVAGNSVASLAPIVPFVIGIQLSVTAGHGRPILEAIAVVVAGSLITGLAATLTWALAWPRRARRAFEAFAWDGEFELERAAAIIEAKPTLANLKRHVRNTPERAEDRYIRVEALAASGKIAEARAVAERLPDHTPLARVERASLLGYTSWLAGSDPDIEGLRAAVDEVTPSESDERLRAEVSIALAEARVLVGAGDRDPGAPLRAVRARIGTRADGILFLASRRLMAGYMKGATFCIVVATLIERATSV
jgi:hypothetical protein